ncbi:MAG: Cbb3-type cytochrome c oxidase subunit CcoP2 [Myxococcota bacterium]|nr:Cbb3-type cytochrome c oxidase subunit CcoP2 [Myxococcota bacterium]
MKKFEREDHLLEHSYDEIQEYDNPLPRWWVYIFWATIVFSVFYWIHYHMTGQGAPVAQSYDEEMAELNKLKAEIAAKEFKPEEANLAAMLANPASIEEGKALYPSRCMPCHGASGEGLVGPNLTDDHWIHTKGTLAGIYNVIDKGVPAKGMIPWGTQLKPAQIGALTAYVASLRGTSPANAKAPEGEQIAPSWLKK